MKIIRMISPLLSENMYILAEDGHCILIDPDAFQPDQNMPEGCVRQVKSDAKGHPKS